MVRLYLKNNSSDFLIIIILLIVQIRNLVQLIIITTTIKTMYKLDQMQILLNSNNHNNHKDNHLNLTRWKIITLPLALIITVVIIITITLTVVLRWRVVCTKCSALDELPWSVKAVSRPPKVKVVIRLDMITDSSFGKNIFKFYSTKITCTCFTTLHVIWGSRSGSSNSSSSSSRISSDNFVIVLHKVIGNHCRPMRRLR